MEKQKWINEGGRFFPIPGYATIYSTPGPGVFQIFEDKNNNRIGLEKIDESFSFNFKIYDLGCEGIFQKIMKTWMSDTFVSGNKNLGVIFNGIKGTGKTIAAKLLSNRIGLPVIVVSGPANGLLEFVQSLCFECVILIDEAEKTFDDQRELLLKMIDGVYNNTRKLYLLTTNNLTVDENLIGRPGRIRYIKQFGNLTAQAVHDFIDDNLLNKSKKQAVLELVDSLIISTIDILKAIVDEFNIHGEISDESPLNIPKAKYKLDITTFNNLSDDKFDTLRQFIVSELEKDETVRHWLNRKWVDPDDPQEDNTNEDRVEKEFGCWVQQSTYPSLTSYISVGAAISSLIPTQVEDKFGFFTAEQSYNDAKVLCVYDGNHGDPSLYRGCLVF